MAGFYDCGPVVLNQLKYFHMFKLDKYMDLKILSIIFPLVFSGNLSLLKVTVNPKPVHVVKVTDEGFAGAVVRLFKGDTVRWIWKSCSEPHNITERK